MSVCKHISIIIVAVGWLVGTTVQAQHHEIGIHGGGTNYFGDLNPYANFESVRWCAGGFYRYNFSPYFALSTNFTFAKVGMHDNFSQNPYNNYRQLSFKANITEGIGYLEFNFFRYQTKDLKKDLFTPYLFLGSGIMYFKNYVLYNNTYIPAQQVGTEQKYYNQFQLPIIIGLGLKWCIKRNFTFALNAQYHALSTDYLDDVSRVYYDTSALGVPINSIADKSSFVHRLSNIKGKQRGDQFKDAYILLLANLSFTFNKKGCPTAGNTRF